MEDPEARPAFHPASQTQTAVPAAEAQSQASSREEISCLARDQGLAMAHLAVGLVALAAVEEGLLGPEGGTGNLEESRLGEGRGGRRVACCGAGVGSGGRRGLRRLRLGLRWMWDLVGGMEVEGKACLVLRELDEEKRS